MVAIVLYLCSFFPYLNCSLEVNLNKELGTIDGQIIPDTNLSIRIVTPTPGLTTTQQVIQLIMDHPQGISAKEISRKLNRPISMIQICLKNLKSSRCIYSRTHKENKQLIYYARFSQGKK
ncbi:MAG: hypothetical protein AB4206_07670 [Xenococcaceae cyanobacterium]